MNKALILPIVALLALAMKQISGYEYSQTEVDIIVEGILAITTLIGIFMTPQKGGKDDELE